MSVWIVEAKWARRGLMRNHRVDRYDDPVGWADAVTSSHDWRIALCIGLGVPLRFIDPCRGYDLRPKQLTLGLGDE